ncbi:hypothetical protein C8R44DRAFT_860422 [Mycena epipterygia]|nr:hypothetical protein C8R44DRAFT_860422 [Mycena epipterygia]
MLSRHSSLSFFALLSCISVVVASPIQNSASLYRRGRNVLIGYRYVSREKAEEYNTYGRLTAVGASGRQLGDGAYISPTINEWNVPDDYWQVPYIFWAFKTLSLTKIVVCHLRR